MLTPTSYRPCPTCGSVDCAPENAYSPDPWQIVTCDSCALTYLRNPVDYAALEEDFAWEKTSVAKRQEVAQGSSFLSPYIRKLRTKLGILHRDKQSSFRQWFNDGHVLDIGCGQGNRIQPPMTPYGIELSRGLHANADVQMRKWGGFCQFGAGAKAIYEFDRTMFDGIVMFSYLEHETDVMGVLKGAHRALKDDGAVYIRVPNFGSLNRRIFGKKWCGFRYPDHVNYFTLKSLKDTAARAGFTTKLVNSVTLPVDDNISVLLRKVSV
ncbi:MAG: class I SAM-dependent methyltransferase [Sulfitobacter sp.]